MTGIPVLTKQATNPKSPSADRHPPSRSAVIDGTDGNDEIEGDFLADDTIFGGAGNDYLEGFFGDDELYGGIGNDTLFGIYCEGGEGDDILSDSYLSATLVGGTGDDTYYINAHQEVDGPADTLIVEQAGGGTDTVISFGGWVILTTTDHVENIVLLGERKVGAYGNALDNVITGNNGSNQINGGAGADIMTGGRGNDTYTIDNLGDQAIEKFGEGNDTIITPFTTTLGATFENLNLNGNLAANGTGNSQANKLTGNSGTNILSGLGGNDTLSGKGGADTLIGGTGNDTYVQDTTYVVSGSNLWDTVTEAASGGIDTVIASADVGRYTYQLDANVENLTASGAGVFRLWGNTLGNQLVGNAAANEFDGFGGRDTLTGGNGADTFHFTDFAAASRDTITDFVPGTDRIQISAAAFGGGLVAGGFVWLFSGPNPTVQPILGTAGQFLYDTDTGALSFDADGSGAGAAVRFATLSNLAALTSADLLIGA